MNKQFSFRMKVNGTIGTYSFSVPCQNGYVITNYYCPKALLIGEDSIIFQIVVPQNGESETEFVKDCSNIVTKANANPDHDTLFCLGQAVNEVMIDHINRCGRLLFQDMLLYMDCFSYLLNAAGFVDSEIKHIYPIITKQIVDVAKNYVKDSHTLLPLHMTNVYKVLCKLANQ